MSGAHDQHIVTVEQDGLRLDRIVAALPSVGSRLRARKAIESGKVTVDGQAAGPADLGRSVVAGATVALTWNRPGTGYVQARARETLDRSEIAILFEDRWILVADKPAGLLTDTATREQSLDRESVRASLQAYLRARGTKPYIVHRIDRDTSGVVVVAKTTEAEAALKEQFADHSAERVYWVAVQGVPLTREGTWSDWMTWDRRLLIQRVTEPGRERAVLASARYRVLESWAPHAAILEVRLITGRRNQIRLHCQVRGHPLYGERLYVPRDWAPRGPEAPRQALHAARIGFRHPGTGEQVTFESPLPADLGALAAKLARWRPR